MKRYTNAMILDTCYLDNDIIAMRLEVGTEISGSAKPGQFVNVYLNDGTHLLPRPISICRIDKVNGILTIIFRIVGEGTKRMADMKAGEPVRIMAPLGHGFSIPDSSSDTRSLIIGGGIGTPPLLELAASLGGNADVVLGFRSRPILENEFRQLGASVYIATDLQDTGYFCGTVIEMARSLKQQVGGKLWDVIYACGPTVMLRAVSEFASELGIACQVSLEERMACGFGVCVGCAVEIEGEFKKVCSDGPVFDASSVVWR